MKEMKEKILALLKSLNLVPADKEAAVAAEIEKMNIETVAPKVDASKVSDPEMKKFLEDLAGQNTVLAQQIKDLTSALAAEKKQREDSIKIAQEQAAAARKADIDKVIADAKKEGRIVEADEPEVRKQYGENLDALKFFVSKLPVNKHAVPPAQSGNDQNRNADGTPKQSQAIANPFTPSRAGILEKVKSFSTVSEN